jgi:carotenoid 1,2-hydratase
MPAWNRPIAFGGYRWLYLDCTSDDKQHSLVVIAMLGNVFSPFYRAARKTAGANTSLLSALDFCTFNIALHSTSGSRFCLTERSREAVSLEATRLQVGANYIERTGTGVRLALSDTTCPIPRPLVGTVDVHFQARGAKQPYTLDPHWLHRWQPLCTVAQVSVSLTAPKLVFRGQAYFDSNEGDAPIEDAFQSWQWSRGIGASGESVVQYDCVFRDGGRSERTFRVQGGETTEIASPQTQAVHLRRTLFAMPRIARLEAESTDLRTLLDAPFYARSAFESSIGGAKATFVHEAVDMDRFVHPLVQRALPYRMRDRRRAEERRPVSAPYGT